MIRVYIIDFESLRWFLLKRKQNSQNYSTGWHMWQRHRKLCSPTVLKGGYSNGSAACKTYDKQSTKPYAGTQEEPCRSSNGADLDVELLPSVSELDEYECEVVHEEQRVGQAERELRQPRVRHVLLVGLQTRRRTQHVVFHPIQRNSRSDTSCLRSQQKLPSFKKIYIQI